MKIFGNQYDFALTVGASAKIAEMCPDGDLSRIGEVLSGNNFSETAKNGAEIVVAMASAADDVKRFEGVSVNRPALTVEMLFALSQADFMAAMTEAMSAFGRDSKPTIEVEPSKKKGNEE
jgi:hypothetical protein